MGRAGDVPPEAKLVPVIYQFDLRDPNQYFYAKAVKIHNKDALYVASASAVQLDKFVTILGHAVGVAAGTSAMAR